MIFWRERERIAITNRRTKKIGDTAYEERRGGVVDGHLISISGSIDVDPRHPRPTVISPGDDST